MAQNHANPRISNSPAESEANEAMARAMRTYRVTNCAGGTELRTRRRSRAIAEFNRLQFPGDVLMRRHPTGPETAIKLELDQDGDWVDVEARTP